MQQPPVKRNWVRERDGGQKEERNGKGDHINDYF